MEGRSSGRHRFTLLPGRHDFTFWKSRIDDSLTFAMEQVARLAGR